MWYSVIKMSLYGLLGIVPLLKVFSMNSSTQNSLDFFLFLFFGVWKEGVTFYVTMKVYEITRNIVERVEGDKEGVKLIENPHLA